MPHPAFEPAVAAAGLFLVGCQYATLFAASRDRGSRVVHLVTMLAW